MGRNRHEYIGSGPAFPQRELTRILNEVSDEVVGFGPVEFLLKDPDVTEVILVGPVVELAFWSLMKLGLATPAANTLEFGPLDAA